MKKILLFIGSLFHLRSTEAVFSLLTIQVSNIAPTRIRSKNKFGCRSCRTSMLLPFSPEKNVFTNSRRISRAHPITFVSIAVYVLHIAAAVNGVCCRRCRCFCALRTVLFGRILLILRLRTDSDSKATVEQRANRPRKKYIHK